VRDVIQQHGGRNLALISLVVSMVIVYFIRDDTLFVGAFAAALFWTEIIDFGLYTYFRQYGWAAGLIVSDVLSAPLLPLIYQWLHGSDVDPSFAILFPKYSALIFGWAVIVLIGGNRTFPRVPMWKNVPWAREARA
jgi:hypothetical protein